MKMIFMGDVVLSNDTFSNSLFSDEFQKIVDDQDVVCCNFEASIGGKSKIEKIGPALTNHPRNLDKLVNGGVNLFALSNNHIYDYGNDGLKNTISKLDEYNVKWFGAGLAPDEIYKPVVYDISGVKVGLLNMCENGFGAAVEDKSEGYAYMFHERISQNIKDLKEYCDAVICVCHGGAELWDVPLPEYRKTYRKFIDKGADLVISHHPHVPQGWEEYGAGKIYYSLGNTAFDKGMGESHPASYAVLVEIENGHIKCHELPLIFSEGKINIDKSEDDLSHIRWCVDILKDSDKYLDFVNKKCLKAYDSMRYDYARVMSDYRGNLKEWAKRIYKKCIKRDSFQDKWLFHNISIETHLWIMQRALMLRQDEDGVKKHDE